MPANQGDFVWYELLTPDVEGASRFYEAVLGWSVKPSGMSERPFPVFGIGDTAVAGLATLCDEMIQMGAKATWVGFVAVNDIAKAEADVRRLGGSVLVGASDVADFGTYAVVADPDGAVFNVIELGRAPSGEGTPRGTPGRSCWRELHATDAAGALDFYGGLLGWTPGETLDMGRLGKYQLFAAGAEPIGAIMTNPVASATPAWHYYFYTDHIDALAGRVAAARGTAASEVQPISDGTWMQRFNDPSGVEFSIVGGAR